MGYCQHIWVFTVMEMENSSRAEKSVVVWFICELTHPGCCVGKWAKRNMFESRKSSLELVAVIHARGDRGLA